MTPGPFHLSTRTKLLLSLLILLSALAALDLHIHNLVGDMRHALQLQSALQDRQVEFLMARLSASPLWILLSSVLAVLVLSVVLTFDIYLPVRNLTTRIIAASEDPENPAAHILARTRFDEIGRVDQALNILLTRVSFGLRSLSEKDRQARQQLSAIEASGDGIGIVDPRGDLVYMNRALMDLHGIGRKDLPRYLNHNWQTLYTDKGRGFVQQVVLPLLRRDGYWRGESPLLRSNGEIIYADMTLNLLEDGGIIGTARDISDRKQAEADRQALYQQLIQAQKMEALGRMTGGIAHDFNNMLTVIDGNLQLIGDQRAALPAMTPHLMAAQHAIDRCAELTHRLLAFSRRQVLKPRRCDPNDLVRESLKLIERTIAGNIEILFRPGSHWESRIDAAQFENALLNLAINARDAMPAGGTITIATVDATLRPGEGGVDLEAGDYIRVAVSDTGAGIPQHILPQVFEPFFTTKETGKGSGLGLSMVYGFARQSGGGAAIASEPGKGTAVTLYFPRMSADEQDDIPPPAIARADPLPRGTETILVVEDERRLLDLAADTLARLGYKVWRASSGAEAVMLLDDIADLRLLLTDVAMPGGIDGIELAQETRDRFSAAAVVYMSGAGSADDPDILSKPFTREQLAQKVRAAIDRCA